MADEATVRLAAGNLRLEANPSLGGSISAFEWAEGGSARSILRKGNTAERASGSERCLPWLEAGFFEFLLLHRTVQRHLLRELGVQLSMPNDVPDPAKKLVHRLRVPPRLHGHHSLLRSVSGLMAAARRAGR